MTKEYLFAEKLLDLLNKKNQEIIVAEFGAWDGIRKSNIRQFALNKCKKAIFIEPNPERFKKLTKNYEHFDNTVTLNSYIKTAGLNSFDNLMAEISVDHLDFLSVDIDGNDYHVFSSIKKILPKIVCIEFNPTIPFDSPYVQENNFLVSKGSSLISLKKLFKRKGYTFLSVVGVNAFFIKTNLVSDEIIDFGKLENSKYKSPVPIELYVGFDGSVFSNVDKIYLNWHRIFIPIKDISPVPKFFRSIPSSFSRFKKFFYYLWLCTKRPEKINFKNIKTYLKSFLK